MVYCSEIQKLKKFRISFILILLSLLSIMIAYTSFGTLKMKSIQLERMRRLKDVCAKMKTPIDRKAWQRYVVDHKRKVVYGWLAKVMSSTMFYAMANSTSVFPKFHPYLTSSTLGAWKFYGIELGDLGPYKHRMHGYALDKFGMTNGESDGPQSLDQLGEDYFFFIIVRDPFVRLLSAFHEMSKHGYKKGYRMWTDTVDHLRKVLQLNDTSRLITFQEFLSYVIIDPHNKTAEIDTSKLPTPRDHWISYEEFLDPCHVKIGYIAKMEDISADLPRIMEKLSKNNSSELLKIFSNKRLDILQHFHF